MPHEIDRQVKTWGTFGKNGDEPLRHILIKDISDSHLENIIIFINRNIYPNLTLLLMLREQQYRYVYNISVPDYLRDFKFFN